MTNQEAIKILHQFANGLDSLSESKLIGSIELATKSLSMDWDIILGEINDQIKRETIDSVESDVAVGLYHALGIIEKHLREVGL